MYVAQHNFTIYLFVLLSSSAHTVVPNSDSTVIFSFVTLFSILFKGNHTIAVVKGPEDYKTLKEGLKNVREAVNSW